MINEKFNIAKQVRDCLNRNCPDVQWIAQSSLEPAIRRLVYKAYRIGCKDGRLAYAAGMPVGRAGAEGQEVHRPVQEVKQCTQKM